MKKQSQIIEITKQNIVDSFWNLYKKKGIEHISVKQVMDDAGYNRCTFYEYFTDIYDTLDYIENSLISYMKANILEQNKDFTMNEFILNRIAFLYEEKGEYLSTLLSEKGDPAFSNKIKSTLKPFIQANFSLPTDNKKADIIFEFTISGFINTFSYWYNNKESVSINDIIQTIYSISSNGMFTEMQKIQKR